MLVESGTWQLIFKLQSSDLDELVKLKINVINKSFIFNYTDDDCYYKFDLSKFLGYKIYIEKGELEYDIN